MARTNCKFGVAGWCLASAVLVVTTSGCMTTAIQASYWRDEPQIAETDSHLYVYGGTVFDAVAFAGGVTSRGEGSIAAVLILDLPFSLVADTLLLPLCIYEQIDRSSWTEERYLPQLVDPDPAKRAKAVHALGALEGATPRRIEALTRLLDDPDVAMRHAALRSLRRLGPASAAAAPRIAQLLRDSDEAMQVRAAEVIVAIGADPAFVATVLIGAMRGPSDDVRAAAVKSLGAIAKDAKEALPVIREALHDPSERVRDAADRALSVYEAAVSPK